MTKEDPLVSVIVPAYNADTFIERTLRSIITQTYVNIEVLVVDDGSQDKTAEIVESFAAKDNRVILLKQKNAGVAAARNLAINKSRGEYKAPIDADDIWYNQKLEKQVQLMLEADRSVGLVYSWSVSIDENDALIGKIDIEACKNFSTVEGTVYPALACSNFIGNGSVPLIRRCCFERVGFYNCEFKSQNAQGCEDWDLYLRIAEHYQFRVVQEFAIGYRQIGGSMSRNYLAMERSYHLLMSQFRQRHPEIPPWMYDYSASNFYLYLSDCSQLCGDYWNSLTYGCQGVMLDFNKVNRLFEYQFLLKTFLKAAGKPTMSLMGLERDSWYQYLRRIKKTLNKSDDNTVVKLTDVREIVNTPLVKSPQKYNKNKWKKWLKILDYCQKTESVY